ncbi:hypothetical protein LINPERHAP1_LOCUS8852, partial [Linum perenne]
IHSADSPLSLSLFSSPLFSLHFLSFLLHLLQILLLLFSHPKKETRNKINPFALYLKAPSSSPPPLHLVTAAVDSSHRHRRSVSSPPPLHLITAAVDSSHRRRRSVARRRVPPPSRHRRAFAVAAADEALSRRRRSIIILPGK